MNQFVAFKGEFKDADAELAADKEFDGDYVPREIGEFVLEGIKKRGVVVSKVKDGFPIWVLTCPLQNHLWELIVGLAGEWDGKMVWSVELNRNVGLLERLTGGFNPLEPRPLLEALHDMLSHDSRITDIRWFEHELPLNPFEEDVSFATSPLVDLSKVPSTLLEKCNRVVNTISRWLPRFLTLAVAMMVISVFLPDHFMRSGLKVGVVLLLFPSFFWVGLLGIQFAWRMINQMKKMKKPAKGDYRRVLMMIGILLGGGLAVAGFLAAFGVIYRILR